jgi:DNA polymerase III delta subunit
MEVNTLMELYKLKENLLEGKLPTQLLIFVCSENFFIADQYVETILSKSGKEKRLINSIFEPESSIVSLFDEDNSFLNILKTEIFSEFAEDYSVFEDMIIVCSKVDKKLASMLTDYIVEVPQLKDWQLESYVKQRCTSLDDLEAQWLVKATNNNIYRIENELDKLSVFPATKQKEILARLRFEPNSDLYNLDVFTLCDAILYNNKAVLVEYLKHQNVCKFDLMNIVGALLKKTKNLLFVKYSRRNAAELGINPGYYKRLLNEPMIPQERLQTILSILSNIDLQLKSGLLEISKDRQIDYLLSKLCY